MKLSKMDPFPYKKIADNDRIPLRATPFSKIKSPS